MNDIDAENSVVRRVYEPFQSGRLEAWDGVIAEDIRMNSSAQFGVVGLKAVKQWAAAFLSAFAPRIDLVDEILALDRHGNGRAVATVNLNWVHVGDFFGLSPTGRSGTSMENLIMTVRNSLVTRIEVADTTLDLVLYLHERGWPFPHNIEPAPIISGIPRDPHRPVIDLRPK